MPLLAVIAGAGLVTAVVLAYKRLATPESDEALTQAYLRGDGSYNRLPPGGIGF